MTHTPARPAGRAPDVLFLGLPCKLTGGSMDIHHDSDVRS